MTVQNGPNVVAIVDIVADIVADAKTGTWNDSRRTLRLICAYLGLPLDTRYADLCDLLRPDPDEDPL